MGFWENWKEEGKGTKGWGIGQNWGGSGWVTPMTIEKTPFPTLPTLKIRPQGDEGSTLEGGSRNCEKGDIESRGRFFWEFWFIFKPGQGE